uniref:Uncharacterized protein n=1 Tax=Cacopsylla melanoneura TaxID=428564 RepID=A0A8D8XU76_9HEMI
MLRMALVRADPPWMGELPPPRGWCFKIFHKGGSRFCTDPILTLKCPLSPCLGIHQSCQKGMIPPSPPNVDLDDPSRNQSQEEEDEEEEEGQEADDTQQGNDGSIRFQVTLEEGDEESIGGI